MTATRISIIGGGDGVIYTSHISSKGNIKARGAQFQSFIHQKELKCSRKNLRTPFFPNHSFSLDIVDDRGELAVVDGNLVDVGLGVGGDGVAKGGGVRGSVRDGAGLDTLEDLVLALDTLDFEIVKVGGDLGGGALDTVGGAGDILRG